MSTVIEGEHGLPDYTFAPANSRTGYGAIDIVVNLTTPEAFAEGRIATDAAFREKVHVREDLRRGLTIENYIEKMDRAGFGVPGNLAIMAFRLFVATAAATALWAAGRECRTGRGHDLALC